MSCREGTDRTTRHANNEKEKRLRYRINNLPASIKIDNGLIVDVDAHALGLDRPKRKSPRAA